MEITQSLANNIQTQPSPHQTIYNLIQSRTQQIQQSTSINNYQFIYSLSSDYYQNTITINSPQTQEQTIIQIVNRYSAIDVLRTLVHSEFEPKINNDGSICMMDKKITTFNTQNTSQKYNDVIITHQPLKIVKQLFQINYLNVPQQNKQQQYLIELLGIRECQIQQLMCSESDSFIIFNEYLFQQLLKLNKCNLKNALLKIESKYKTFFVDSECLKNFENLYKIKSKTIKKNEDLDIIKKYLKGDHQQFDKLSIFAKEVLSDETKSLKEKLDFLGQKQIIYTGTVFRHLIVYGFEFQEISNKLLGQITWFLSNKQQQINKEIMVTRLLMSELDDFGIPLQRKKIKLQKIILSQFVKKLQQEPNNPILLPIKNQIQIAVQKDFCHNNRGVESILLNYIDNKRYIDTIKNKPITDQLCSQISTQLGCFMGTKQMCKQYIQQFLEFHIIDKKAQQFHNLGNQQTAQIISQYQSNLQQINNRLDPDLQECGVCFMSSDINIILPCCLKHVCLQCTIQVIQSNTHIQCVYCRRGFQMQELCIVNNNVKNCGTQSMIQKLTQLLNDIYYQYFNAGVISQTIQQKTVVMCDSVSQVDAVRIAFKIFEYMYHTKINPQIENVSQINTLNSNFITHQLIGDFCQSQTHNHKFDLNKYNKIKAICNTFNNIKGGLICFLNSQYIDFDLLELSDVNNVICIQSQDQRLCQQEFIYEMIKQKKEVIDFKLCVLQLSNDDDDFCL